MNAKHKPRSQSFVPDTTGYALARFAAACKEEGADPDLLASKCRARHTTLRERVTAHMRAPDANGLYCSYREIANVCGRRSWSTFVEAHQRYTRRQADAKNHNPTN